MDNFKVGDVVALKSGGPEMTVRFILGNHKLPLSISSLRVSHDDGDLVCVWFDGHTEKQDVFNPAMVKVI